MKCQAEINKTPCGEDAIERYSWPGSAEWTLVCGAHGQWARKVSAAIGLVLRVEPLEPTVSS